MKLTFVSNFINHHQAYLADEFYALLGSDFAFVCTERIAPEFQKYVDFKYADRPYLLNSYLSDLELSLALQLCSDSDVVVIGSAPEKFIENRLLSNKIVFRYSERWFKKGDHQAFSPRAWYYIYKNYLRFRNRRHFMLCASAYTANDVSKFCAFNNKMFKWGYFPAFREIDIIGILNSKTVQTFSIVWVARLIDWKHPELVIKLALYLKKKKYDFKIEMYGDGELEFLIRNELRSLELEEFVKLNNVVNNDEILAILRKSNVLLCTSDRGEGWGVVVNEAMSNGCTVVASHAVGSVPFLIENGVEGLVFRSGNSESLNFQVERLINDRVYCNYLASKAYKKIASLWNPKIAATSFLELAESIIIGKEVVPSRGPCSKAYPVRCFYKYNPFK